MSNKKAVGRPEKVPKLKRKGLLIMVTDQNKKDLKNQLQIIANKLDAQLNAEKSKFINKTNLLIKS